MVVEHEEEGMRAADYIVDMGPRAGRLGGEVVFKATMPICRLASEALPAVPQWYFANTYPNHSPQKAVTK